MIHHKTFFHLISSFDVGGCESMLSRTLPHLTEGEHRLVILRPTLRNQLIEQLEKSGIGIDYLDAKSLWDRRAISRFRTLTKKYHPEALTTYLLHANFFGRVYGRIFGIKRIYTSIRSTHSRFRFFPYWVAERCTAFLVTHYLAVSSEVKKFYVKRLFFSEKDISVVYNGIDLSRFDRTVDTVAKRRELGVGQEVYLLGCIAQLRIREKGQKYLIKAMEAVVKQVPDVVLLLIGNGQDWDEVEKEIADRGLGENIKMLGNRKDVPELLAILDLFVLPTLFEGMCNTLLEAQATGCAIVTTDIPENREILTHNETAYLIPVADSKAIEKSILKLLNNPELRKKLAQGAKANSKKFDLHFCCDRLNGFYKEGSLD